MIRYISLILFSGLVFNSCGQKENPPVQIYGALFEIMHKGDLSSRISLNQFDNDSNIFGLGALKDLKGEILILDSKPYISYEAGNGEVGISNDINYQAALYVHAVVKKWNKLKLPTTINTTQQFEKHIETISGVNGINIEEPFPFMIKGIISKAEWHIINWDSNDVVHSHKKHIESGLSGVFEDKPITILGFYSKNHKTIFTHHSTYIHMHFLTDDKKIAGHVDDIIFRDNQTLYLSM
jgi:acetolactate decarboxylase